MSGLTFRVGAAVIAVTTLATGLAVGATPVVGFEDAASATDLTTIPPLSTPPAPTDGIPAPIANQTGTTAIPLPPGVVVGLIGLASAAIARHRYLKRH